MKKTFLLSLAALFLLQGCFFDQKPVELNIEKRNVELTGNGYQAFSLGANVKLVMVENPDEAGKWAIRASVPLRKEADKAISVPTIEISMLDASGMKVRDNFVLVAEDLDNVIPLYNNGSINERTIVFSAGSEGRKNFSFKEAADMLNKTESLTMTINFGGNAPAVAAASQSGEMTLSSLLEKYSIYWRLNQYEKALRERERKRAKQIEDEMYTICNRVDRDSEVPKWLAQRFRDYIEDKEDEIEDRI